MRHFLWAILASLPMVLLGASLLDFPFSLPSRSLTIKNSPVACAAPVFVARCFS